MISFASIYKQYGKQLIFVDASFQLNPGEKVGLVGPNGAGKTTLFRMVVGVEDPDRAAEMDSILARFGEVQEEYELLGGYAVEAQAREVLHGLGFHDGQI